METLPNEILLHIFSYFECALIITHGLSYNKCCSILFPLIFNSSSLCSSIQRIHFHGTNSIACDLSYEWLFNDKKILRFPNLKTLILTRCGSIEPVVQCLSYLIKHQLDELTLTFDGHVFKRFHYIEKYLSVASDKEKQLAMIEQLLCQLFSSQCELTSRRLDINDNFEGGSIHRYLLSNSNFSSNFLPYQFRSYCMTLHHLYIRLNQTYFFHNLIEHVPNLEQMSVQFNCSLRSYSYVLTTSNIENLSQSNENWFNKILKLRCFSLKTFIDTDLEFIYLKWLLNNLNYVEKLELHLKSYDFIETKNYNIWKSFIDANFIRQYCLPDTIPNLVDFNFFICSECELSYNDIERITNSFKIHPFFHFTSMDKCQMFV
ncbi:unnamed protein product [Rotaria sordida]|uniref:F-box domain-containing protein n=1 Tax=Rotaria sordida TaxID=392033 RepID=A0A815QVR9_9BILA|nr:unnamed protein product [Rotaria sordida]